jgi:hypothetical protein
MNTTIPIEIPLPEKLSGSFSVDLAKRRGN